MQTLETVAAVRAWRAAAPGAVGFVPTMGALHAGHLALVRRARDANAQIIVSIFVNPLQFGSGEDFTRYPRDLDADSALLRDAGVDALFFPAGAEMYPAGFATGVEVTGPLTASLEGAARPGHFRGVTTVVNKLLNIVQPTRAYFGLKDAQQLLVIAKMVRDLAMPLELVPVPTVRDPDGVALSSRNRYLSPDDRRAAAAIPRALDAAEARFAAGVRDASALRRAVAGVLAAEPRLRPEYVSCAALETLAELEQVAGPALLSLAVRCGPTRLIDNRWLGVTGGVPLL